MKVMLALLALCNVSAARFPIGLYEVYDPALLKEVRKAGFDVVFVHEKDPVKLDAYVAQAKRAKVKLLLMPELVSSRPAGEMESWPIEAWYLQDEPDVNRVSPEQMRALSAEARKRDPKRPQTFVVGQGSAARAYGAIGDVLMLDWYPVPHLSLESVGDQIESALEALPEGKPLWMVVQAFDWRKDPQRDPKKPRIGRFPTFEEMRFMSYQAVIAGASGLFFYTFRHGDGSSMIPDHPQEWGILKRLGTELDFMRPVFEKGRRIPLPMPPDPDLFEAAAWRYRGRDYVVIVNSFPTFQPLPAELYKSGWRPLFEKRRRLGDLLHSKPGGELFLSPYRVLVLEGPPWRKT